MAARRLPLLPPARSSTLALLLPCLVSAVALSSTHAAASTSPQSFRSAGVRACVGARPPAGESLILRLRGGATNAAAKAPPSQVGKVGGLIGNVMGMGGASSASVGRMAALRAEMQGKLPGEAKDRKLMYFLTQGPKFFLNPYTYIMRYIRGTELLVSTAVMYCQVHSAEDKPIEDIKAFLASPGPEGLSMTPGEITEALYRSGLDAGSAADAAEKVGASMADFADEEDEELKQFTDKISKGGTTKGGGKVHKLATQKWTGSSGNVVKRLQKELITIQGTGAYEVELVNDNIFEWYVTLEGSKGSFYENEKFKLRFKFDSTYPQEPPAVTFLAKVPGWPMPEVPGPATGKCPTQAVGAEWPARWGPRKHHCPIHPHVYTNGNICLSTIYDDWSPAFSVESVCQSLISMMASAKEKNPPADNEMHLDATGISDNAKKIKGWDFHDAEA